MSPFLPIGSDLLQTPTLQDASCLQQARKHSKQYTICFSRDTPIICTSTSTPPSCPISTQLAASSRLMFISTPVR